MTDFPVVRRRAGARSAQGTISGTLRAGDTFEPFFGWLVG